VSFKGEARAKDISERTIPRALNGVTYNKRIIRLAATSAHSNRAVPGSMPAAHHLD
jgi:membrane-bound lytic murein transglycosylase B